MRWEARKFQSFRGNVNGNQSRSGVSYKKYFAMATSRRPRFIFRSSTVADYVSMAFPNRDESGVFLLTWWLEMTPQFRDKTVKLQSCPSVMEPRLPFLFEHSCS